MKKQPSFLQSIFPIVFMIGALAVGYGYLGYRAEPILITSAFVAGFIALRLGYRWKDLQAAIIEKIARAMPATLVLWSVGLLIGSWIFSGTVPMIIYYGVQVTNPKFLLVSAFLITALVSTVTGTSWGSAGTIGLAIMGIASGLGVSLPATAGAVVAGAYFGDKISPLSDTTNLAPIAAGTDLYAHIKHMFYTTIPATIVAVIIYLLVGLRSSGNAATPQAVTAMLEELNTMFTWNPLLLLPVAIILTSSIIKLPAVPTMLGTSLFSVALGVLIQGFSLKDGLTSLIKGFSISMSGVEPSTIEHIARLVNRGGVVSVTSTTVLIFCAMGFAGIMSCSGMLNSVLQAMLQRIRSTASLVLSTILSCITMAIVTGSSYLSILIPGELFKDSYVKRGLDPKNLSRTLEDSVTVFVPLVPWSAAGAYMTATLGVDTVKYLPWAVFNYMGIVFAIFIALSGVGIARLEKPAQEAQEKKL